MPFPTEFILCDTALPATHPFTDRYPSSSSSPSTSQRTRRATSQLVHTPPPPPRCLRVRESPAAYSPTTSISSIASTSTASSASADSTFLVTPPSSRAASRAASPAADAEGLAPCPSPTFGRGSFLAQLRAAEKHFGSTSPRRGSSTSISPPSSLLPSPIPNPCSADSDDSDDSDSCYPPSFEQFSARLIAANTQFGSVARRGGMDLEERHDKVGIELERELAEVQFARAVRIRV